MKGYQRGLARGPALSSRIIKPMFNLQRVQFNIADPGSANAFFTQLAGAIPEGNFLFLGAIANLQFTKVSGGLADTFAGNIAIGSAPTADATLNGSEVDLIASTAVTTAVAGVSAYKRYANATAVMLDNTDNSLEINLNGFIADASISAAAVMQVDGQIQLALVPLLDD